MRKDAHENRLEILKAARYLFAQQGSDVSMRAIAAAAGVGIATLYRNFPTRNDLFRGLAEQVVGEVEAITAQCLVEWDVNPEQAWRTYVHRIIDLQLAGVAIDIVSDDDNKALVDELAQELMHQVFPAVMSVLEQAKSAGLVAEDIDLDRFRIGNIVISRPLPHLPTFKELDEKAWLIDVYIRGLRPH